jgi:uncharacterized membrane protein
MAKSKNFKLDSYQKFAFSLIGLASVGLIAAFILMLEKIQLLKNPAAQLSCNINPIVSCNNVITSKQAEAFGFANPIIGLVSFAVIITIGMGMLAGAKYKRWFWLGLQSGTIFGALFITWLFYEAVYHIKALCPYCIVVWAMVIPLFVYVTRYNILEGNIKVSKPLQGVSRWFCENAWFIVALWYLAIFTAILMQFWYYWKTLI